MKEIPLNQGRIAFVDDEDYEWLMQLDRKWSFSGSETKGVAACYIKGKQLKMHRLIMNAPEGVQVDHIDGNRMNNTRANLRLCSNIENSYNRRLRKDSSTGYKGVRWQVKNQRFWARIQANGKRVSLGLYDDPVDAAKAYDRAAKELHGKFARLNFPE